MSYADHWSNGSCAPTQGNSASYATSVKNVLNQTTLLSYNSCTGTLATSTDPNNRTITLAYDVMDRRVQASLPDGGQTCLQYSDAPNSFCASYSGPILPIHVASSKKLSSSSSEISTTVLDGLSRQTQTQLNSDPYGTDYVDTTYDGIGRVYSISNPYRSTSDPTYGITSYSYDALGRKLLQCQPDNGNNNPCVAGSSSLHWLYAGNVTTFSDEVGNRWQRSSDALGRLKNVLEQGTSSKPLNLATTYTYDVLDNLTNVSQTGVSGELARNRSFTYDSLSRLLCASNPENSQNPCPASATSGMPSGVITYSYDANGNLSTKTDARGVISNYQYDSLNRITAKTYTVTGTTAAATRSSCYQYDTGVSNPLDGNFIGRLTHEWTQSGSCSATLPTSGSQYQTRRSILAYDPMGRVIVEQQCHLSSCTTNRPYVATPAYDLAGNLTFYSNGVGPVGLTSNYDGAGRLSSITNFQFDTQHPALLFSVGAYAPMGAIENMTLGPQINVTKTYDKRLRGTTETATHP